MTLLAPWGLLALLGMLPVIGMHVWRRRRRQRLVTGLFLYGISRVEVGSGGRLRPLRQRLSLWLELAAVLLLSLWLAQPAWLADAGLRHIVLVLDDHQRLQMERSDGQQVAELLRRTLDERLAQLAADDVVSLIRSGAVPQLLVGPMADVASAREVLRQWQPAAANHEYHATIDFARLMAEGQAQLVWAGDQRPKDLPETWGILLRGESRAHSGLTGLYQRQSAERPGDVLLTVVVEAFHAQQQRSLRILREQEELLLRDLSLEPGRPQVIEWPLSEPGELQVLLEGDDPLPSDDQVRVQVDLPAPLRVLLESSDAELLSSIRSLLPALHAQEITSLDQAELLISDVASQAVPARAWSLRIVAGSGPPAWGPFAARSGHPLLQGLDSSGLLWSGGALREDAPQGQALVQVAGQTLISWDEEVWPPRVHWYIQRDHSNILRHPALSVLLSQLFEAVRSARPGPAQSWALPQQDLTLSLPRGQGALTLQPPRDAPQQKIWADRHGRIARLHLNQPGEWLLHSGDSSWPLHILPLSARQYRQHRGEEDERPAALPGIALSGPAAPGMPAKQAIAGEQRPDRLIALFLLFALATALVMSWWAQLHEEQGL